MSDELNIQAPLISIVIPVYNNEKYINECVESLLNQTYKKLEIIIIDDGSSDTTAQICDKYAEIDSRIKVVHRVNGGVSRARNQGIKIATGDYIGFIDGDDIVEPDLCEFCMKNFEEFQVDVVRFRFDRFTRNIEKNKNDSYKILADSSKAIALINTGKEQEGVCNGIYKKSVIKGVRFTDDITIGEDYEYVMRIFDRVKKILFCNKVMYHYRVNPNSVCSNGFSEKSFTNFLNYKKIYVEFKKKYPEREREIFAYYFLQGMAVIISMVKSTKYDNVVAKKIKLELRKSLKNYLKNRFVPVILKICACLMCIHEYCLIIPYRIFVHPWRKVKNGKNCICDITLQ